MYCVMQDLGKNLMKVTIDTEILYNKCCKHAFNTCVYAIRIGGHSGNQE